MFCESYERSLKDAAVSGELTPTLSDHLAVCASCRSAFAEEQSIYAAIDSSLHTVANAEVPTTLIPRVHVALNNELIRQNTSRFWLVAAASLLVAGVFIGIYLRPHGTSSPTVATRNAPNRDTPPAPTISSVVNPPSPGGVSTLQHGHTMGAVRHQASGASSVEVIVEPQEAAALLRYEARLRQRAEPKPQTLLAKAIELPVGIQPLEIAEMEVGDLKIPALAKAEADADRR